MPVYSEEGEIQKAGIKIEAIACGLYHSLALTDEGEAYSWG